MKVVSGDITGCDTRNGNDSDGVIDSSSDSDDVINSFSENDGDGEKMTLIPPIDTLHFSSRPFKKEK